MALLYALFLIVALTVSAGAQFLERPPVVTVPPIALPKISEPMIFPSVEPSIAPSVPSDQIIVPPNSDLAVSAAQIAEDEGLDRELSFRCNLVSANPKLLSPVERSTITDLWQRRDLAWRQLTSDETKLATKKIVAQTCARALGITLAPNVFAQPVQTQKVVHIEQAPGAVLRQFKGLRSEQEIVKQAEESEKTKPREPMIINATLPPPPTVNEQRPPGGKQEYQNPRGQFQSVVQLDSARNATSDASNEFPHPPISHQTRAVSVSNNVAGDAPKFNLLPWPAPVATTSVPYHRINDARRGGFKNLGELDNWLEDTLKSAGYYEYKYWNVPGGFALVTRLEPIDDDARPVGKERFIESEGGQRDGSLSSYGWSLVDYLVALTSKPVNRARVFLFAVTNDDQAESNSTKMTTEYAKDWLEGGTHSLAGLKDVDPSMALTEKHVFMVLVYEFLNKKDRGPEVVETTKGLTINKHLRASGLKIAEHFK